MLTAFAYCIAYCPSPPQPMIANQSPSFSSQLSTEWNAVIPAQNSGAVFDMSRFVGNFTAFCQSTTAYSAKKPSTTKP